MNPSFENLELHDGDLGDVTLKQDNQGHWSLAVSVRVESAECRLLFIKCRLIKADIKGGMARADVIDKYEATSDSEIFRMATSWPSPLPVGARHYFITTNSGSRIDVVAETFESTLQEHSKT